MSVKSRVQSPPNWKERKMEGAYEGVGKKSCCKTNKAFNNACKRENVEPTPRQYARWINRMGRWS
jgi:hypothetical protein